MEISKALQLASAHHQAGRLVEAEAVCKQILQVSPNHPDALYLMGMIAYQIGMHDVAAVFFSGVIEVAPHLADAHNNLGVVLMAQGQLAEAAASYQKAISLQPGHPNAHYNLGNAFKDQGRLDDAVASYQKAIVLTPENAPLFNNLGDVLQTQGKLTEAVANYRKALRINPNLAEVHHNLGDALRELGQLDEAVAFCRLAILIKPDYAEAYSSLGNALQHQGKLEETIACYRQALSIKPDSANTYSNLLLTMQYMSTVTPAEVFSEHQRYAERYETPLKANWLPHPNSRVPDRRLRIGYVSGDFRNHAVTFFIEPILASHDKSQVEIYCYYTYGKHDSHTERIAAYADHWLACPEMSDEALADRIRADGIDILVDLSGHTGYNRLPVFARKPAPLQATWIGYAGSTGLTAMDYRITNEEMDPPGLTERYHSETLLRMPDSGVAYRPEPGCPLVNPLPALTSGEFVFASLNNLIKTNPSVVELWARILNALPHARLMLGNVTDSGTRQRVIDQFGQAGVTTDRLILQPRMPLNDYLALHHQIDLALDPFPYNGGTTTVHALWMGVPVVTLAGEHMVSRCAVPLLSRVGLDEFITHNEEDYFQRAVRMAQDLPGLDRIRQSLRERMSTSNYGPQTVTRHLEAAYREMWRKWCTR
ncbi:MAG: tetratricopeptide repeat protein [Thiobacillus sp.]|nr:tetratricopeptide repeat protein [Thiobacillus sp.]